jgi:hypothetical protein
MSARWLRFVLPLLFAGLGCQGEESPADGNVPCPPPWFEDVTEACGLNFVHDPGPVGTYFMPQIVGSGCALFDYDGDGRLDVYLVQNAGPDSGVTNRLFHQEKDGTFRDVSKGSGLDVAGYGMGVAIGDVNNDGRPDVFLTEYGRCRLFLNNGDGTFTDVTKDAGLDNPRWCTSAAFVDYDRDGWLDLVVVNYLDYGPDRPCTDLGGRREFCPPTAFAGTVSHLFHNLGRGPGGKGIRFEDVTHKAGLEKRPGPGLGVVCADFDGDGWPDILIANDRKANHLWINQHDGTFKDGAEEALRRGLAYNADGQPQANMGIALGDVDGDGLFDVFITHLTEETHTLWKQGPRGMFQDRSAALGVTATRYRGTGFGTVMADFDHDGAPDLAVANGRVLHSRSINDVSAADAARLGPFWVEYAERNQLLANDGKGHFRDVSADSPAFCGPSGVFRGLACGDIDGDGAIDLLLTEVSGRVRLFRNVAPKRGHWLMVRALDPRLHRDAYGAEVTVVAAGRRWKQWVNPASSFLCSNDPRAHFGLGSAECVEAIEVLWPDGLKETFPGGPVDKAVVLCRGEGR